LLLPPQWGLGIAAIFCGRFFSHLTLIKKIGALQIRYPLLPERRVAGLIITLPIKIYHGHNTYQSGAAISCGCNITVQIMLSVNGLSLELSNIVRRIQDNDLRK
jgi:hypothetical protein